MMSFTTTLPSSPSAKTCWTANGRPSPTTIASDSRITGSLPCRLSSVTAESPSYSLSVYLDVVPPEEIRDFVDLHDYRTGEPLVPDESGVIITQKMAELLNLKVGDTFTVDSDGRFTVTVAALPSTIWPTSSI